MRVPLHSDQAVDVRAGLDVMRIREDFPILATMIKGRKLVYLDNAATTQKPRAVLAAHSVFSLAIVFQVAAFIDSDNDRYMGYLNREMDKPALVFHDLAKDALKPLHGDDVFAYYDARMYFPPPQALEDGSCLPAP